MNLILSNARRLKPEARLGQAIVRFEALLSKEQKAAFEAGRINARASPPSLRDVMQLTAEIDLKTRTSGRRCFGPRMTKILESVQQFASIGDVILGGSQNLIACGVWSLVRLTLLTAVRFSTYLESLSSLLVAVGSSAPRYGEMVALHPKSKVLTTLGLDYFTTVVRLCHEVITVCNKSTVGQLQTFFKNLDITTHKSDLLNCSAAIKDQLGLEESRENSKARELLNKLSSNELQLKHRRRLESRLNLLKACSTFDYQAPWKQARKCGNVSWIDKNREYKEWRDSEIVSTLLVSGKLGAGKSVLLANSVDEMNLQPNGQIVAYFFCRVDNYESTKAHTLMGSLARQVSEACELDTIGQLWKGTQPTMNDIDMRVLFSSGIFRNRKLCFILDGIDECNRGERQKMVNFLEYIRGYMPTKFCISYRQTTDPGMRRDLDCLKPERALEMPIKNPDIEHYI